MMVLLVVVLLLVVLLLVLLPGTEPFPNPPAPLLFPDPPAGVCEQGAHHHCGRRQHPGGR